MDGGFGFSGPHQQTANRMTAIEGTEQAAHLIAVPDIAALKLGQSHMPAVDMVEDRGDFHMSRILPVSSSCIVPSLSMRVLASFASSEAISASMSERMVAMAVCSSTAGTLGLSRPSALREMCLWVVPPLR